jgi:hypothetical protein
VVLAVGALALVYFLLFPTSSPKPLALTSSTAAKPISSATGITGSWKLGSGSVAGYRVREKLGFLPAQSDAVGRTSAITGKASLTESNSAVTVTAASFVVAVNTLRSDRSMRDDRIHTIGLQSDQYPRATFKLSTPVSLPASALTGHVVHVSATGVFNIHGTSKRETVPLQMSLSSSAIQAVGSLTFPWSEFNMTAPSVGGFVNVTNKATMEFDLHLQPA